jgi:hypothetical protein
VQVDVVEDDGLGAGVGEGDVVEADPVDEAVGGRAGGSLVGVGPVVVEEPDVVADTGEGPVDPVEAVGPCRSGR